MARSNQWAPVAYHGRCSAEPTVNVSTGQVAFEPRSIARERFDQEEKCWDAVIQTSGPLLIPRADVNVGVDRKVCPCTEKRQMVEKKVGKLSADIITSRDLLYQLNCQAVSNKPSRLVNNSNQAFAAVSFNNDNNHLSPFDLPFQSTKSCLRSRSLPVVLINNINIPKALDDLWEQPLWFGRRRRDLLQPRWASVISRQYVTSVLCPYAL